jgi:predicted RecB family endonuclease
VEPVIVTSAAMISALSAMFRRLHWTIRKPAEGEAHEIDLVVTDHAGHTYAIEAKEGIGEAHFASIAQVDRLATRLRQRGEDVTPVLLTTQKVAPSMSKIAEKVWVESVEARGSADEIADTVVKRLQD